MKDTLVIILYDHPLEHTADYAIQTSSLLRKYNLVIGVLCHDARSIKEVIVQRQRVWLWRKLQTNYYLFKPLYIIPFRRFKLIEQLDILLNTLFFRSVIAIIATARGIKRRYLWIYNPEQYLTMKLFGPSFFTIYDCVDYHGSSANAQTERQLLRSCNKVFVNSHTLYDMHKKVRSDVVLVPLGFDLKRFSQGAAQPVLRLPKGKPIIGYIGGINSRLDFSLLVELARKQTKYHFVFVGPVQKHEYNSIFDNRVKPKINELFSLPNVSHIPSVSKNSIVSIIKQFNIGIIPYDAQKAFNRFCYPMKLFEYFYAGKPVVATPIKELRWFSKFVRIGKTTIDWENNIKEILSKSWPMSFQREQKDIAVENSWEKKMARINDVTKSRQTYAE